MRRRAYLLAGLMAAAFLLGAALGLAAHELDRDLEPAPTVSPSYWHYMDAVEPREDTAHYYGDAIGDFP